mmetsp:Transcript_18758/g.40678  ORF Transcript_18758/g.40678 Transcript_18758/m.40678 type:complete len:139 (+) Transcript_18758:886-1302(+)
MGGNGVTSLDDSSDGIDVGNGVDTGEVLGFTDGIGVDSSIGAIVGLCVSCLKGVTANTKSSLSVWKGGTEQTFGRTYGEFVYLMMTFTAWTSPASRVNCGVVNVSTPPLLGVIVMTRVQFDHEMFGTYQTSTEVKPYK